MEYCQREGYSDEIISQPYPHPYIILWLEALRHGNPMDGSPSYPEPEKGYLEQDADLMLGFAVCEEYRAEQQQVQKKREQVADLVRKQGW